MRKDKGLIFSPYYLPCKYCHFTLHVLDNVGWDCVPVAVPHGEVGIFADFDGPNFVFKKELMRRRDRVGAQRGMNVDCFGSTKWLRAVCSIQSLTSYRRPDAVTRGEWRHGVIGSSCPGNSLF